MIFCQFKGFKDISINFEIFGYFQDFRNSFIILQISLICWSFGEGVFWSFKRFSRVFFFFVILKVQDYFSLCSFRIWFY